MDAENVTQRNHFRKVIENRSARIPWSGCWIWEGALNNRGYGQITAFGKPWLAHRASYFAAVGAIPRCVMHLCDTPSCVNPAHLSGGDQLANMRDMASKGRNKGRRSRPKFPNGYKTQGGRRKKTLPLSAENVREIASRVHGGESQRQVAAVFKISQQQVSLLMAGKHWQFQ